MYKIIFFLFLHLFYILNMNLGIFPSDIYLNISFLLIEEFINVTNTIFIALIL